MPKMFFSCFVMSTRQKIKVQSPHEKSSHRLSDSPPCKLLGSAMAKALCKYFKLKGW